jgi:beta-glucosidase
VFFTAGPAEPWELTVDEGVAVWDEAGGRKVVSWPGGSSRAVAIRGKQAVSLASDASAGKELAVDVLVEKRPVKPVTLSVGCGDQCSGSADITARLNALPLNEWSTIRVPLRELAAAGADLARVDVPFRIATEGELALRFADIEVVRGSTAPDCH